MWSSEEKRKHLRYSYQANIQYMVNPPGADEIYQGAVVNVSNSGMSLFVTKPLDIGQEITIRSNLPNLAGTAIVRWIKQVGGCYKVGAECNDMK